jgi:hypothetical protein
MHKDGRSSLSGAASPPLPLAGEGRGEGRAACSPLTLPSLTRWAPPSPTVVGEGILSLGFHSNPSKNGAGTAAQG